MHNSYKPQKQKINPEKSGAYLLKKRMKKLLDIVEQHGIQGNKILDVNLQLILNLGPGQYYEVKTAVKARHSDLIKWHKKTKEWEWIGLIEEIDTTETVKQESLEAIPNE